MGLIEGRNIYNTTLFEISTSLDDWNICVGLNNLSVSNITDNSFDVTQSGITMTCILDGNPDISFLHENDMINAVLMYRKQDIINSLFYKAVGKQKIEIV